MPASGSEHPRWWVYVLVSRGAGKTYVGIAVDPERRLAQHNGERVGGARSTRAGRPWANAALFGPFGTRGEASRHEHAVKRLRGAARFAYDPGSPEARAV